MLRYTCGQLGSNEWRMVTEHMATFRDKSRPTTLRMVDEKETKQFPD
jgi:hypothetical protein